MRVVVFGAGAVGSLLGAYLDRAGHSVLLIGRSDHVAAIRSNGLRVTGSLDGVFRLEAATEIPPGPAPEAVLLTVKTFDLELAAASVGRGVRPGTPILLLQNGLGVLEGVRRTLAATGWMDPETALVRGLNFIPATLEGPGEVRGAGEGEIVLPVRAPPAADAIGRFEQLLRGTGFRLRSTEDLTREVWRKAIVNAAINPVTAEHGVTNGRLLESPFREEAEHLLLEAAEVARVVGVEVTDDEARVDLDRVVRATASNRSSMLQDVERHRPTEIDAISGTILELGRKHRFDMWFTERAVASVRTRAAEIRSPPSEPS